MKIKSFSKKAFFGQKDNIYLRVVFIKEVISMLMKQNLEK